MTALLFPIIVYSNVLLLVVLISLCLSLLHHVRLLAHNVERVHQATNSMHDEIVRLTHDVALTEGIKEGLRQGRAEKR